MPRPQVQRQQSLVPTLPQYGPAMAWLRAHGLSHRFIAGVFGTTEQHVGVLVHRSRARMGPARAAPRFETIPFQTIVEWPLTFKELEPVRRRRDALRPEAIRQDMEEIVRRNAQEYTFLQGVAELNRLRACLSDPRSEALVRLLAELHCHKAWFFTHVGFSWSSIEEANQAYELAADLYRRTNSLDELQIIADAALIASNSHLIRHGPVRARQALRLAAEAREKQGAHLNEEYYRQLAVANLQISNDREARRGFLSAAGVMWQHGHAEDDVGVLLSARGPANILPPVNWDGSGGALDVLDSVSRHFPPHSNEFNIAVSWTAACGLSTDSPSAHLKAQELVQYHCPHAVRFGHRATVVGLLRLVPALPRVLWADFVRFAVYQNAFSDR